MCRYLSGSSHGSDLLLQFIEQFVFSPGLWARANTDVSSKYLACPMKLNRPLNIILSEQNFSLPDKFLTDHSKLFEGPVNKIFACLKKLADYSTKL